MFGLRRLTQRLAMRQSGQATKRRQSSLKDMYPDRAAPKAKPDYSSPNGAAFEAGTAGTMEFISGGTVLLTIMAFLYMPFTNSEQSLDIWARAEAEARLARKEDGEDVEYGVWYSETKPWLQKEGEDDDE